ncbi:glutamate synthase-related protein [Desulfococcus multivorans]|jgi:glutamate synthase domain-containing protein 2|uniref:glutamate synthase (NADPH) n=1 Tax=Desulfococcus multivorans DSM 2059 TaxID=1121405 RepID=S7TC08_DESML|nr:glutamate synthase-related protein [Desulfococcus multivorans]AOY59510.1 putative glutamate synthase, large subunit [Desulfococcus multivorans]AQV01706.1 glutamate synthase [Desulfococcus multivorans]EPR34156.1 ferredoxin-dependent glutamate synthase [Desulfococcus multivorans DSM 2059]MDX9818763.1 glutamate synthase-related protein [Desulfococcus multivorans]SKA19531.1 GXGXG motif-containing protein [Desulfococcus multivorans DSM 2059]
MATIDLSHMSVRTANEVIKGYGAVHEDIDIINPDARHYIAVGLTNPIRLRIHGSAGYFCGGLTDGPHIDVERNVSWGVGDNMLAGTVVVGGNAGALAGEALRGGTVVIRGNMGSRAGQVMKKGTLCCAGHSSFMAGYMMYGGRMVILGDSGERVGENMVGGEIFVGGRIQSMGNDAAVVAPTDEETASVMAFLDRFDIRFNGRFKKIVCAGGDLRYGIPESRRRIIPHTLFSGNGASYWNEKTVEDIRIKSAIGRCRIRGFGAARHVPHFSDIAFRSDPECLSTTSDPVSRVAMRTLIGDKHGARALDLSMPVMVAPMSFGALSPKMKTALGIASRLSGISENTGEGGMYSVERAEARQLIAQCLSGRLGWNIHDMKRADGLEIYISQGAKPGLGGQLMAAKLTREIAALRGIPEGMDLRSPSRHPDILGGDDLIMKVREFREAVGWRLPVSIKLGGGRTRDDVKIAFKDGLDFVELDGLQGGTGAAGSEVAEYVGIPTVSALMEALDGLAEIGAEGQLPIVVMGGIQSGVDAAKAIAMGATAVGLGTSMLIAGGCIGCMDCSSGNCPMGIATQSPERTSRFDVEKQAWRMHTYLESMRFQLAAVTCSLGYTDVRQLNRGDLVALTPEAAELTRLPYAPEYRKGLREYRPGPKESKPETGTANFSRKSFRLIRAMSGTPAVDDIGQREILRALWVPREDPFPLSRPSHLDDVVFLSAALTRLVIDPYRESCSTRTHIARSIEIGDNGGSKPTVVLAHPLLFTGFDGAPENVRQALARALAATGCGYVGRKPPAEDFEKHRHQWFQLVADGDRSDPRAVGMIYEVHGGAFSLTTMTRCRSGQLLGLAVKGPDLAEAVPYALHHRFDMLLLDGSGIGVPWSELKAAPDLTVMRDAIRLLRDRNMEEEIALLNFGGMRSGTDVAKALAMNCTASVIGAAMGFAAGGVRYGDILAFQETDAVPVLEASMINWIKAAVQEIAVIARCTGKTNVHNLEPEDMRTITLAACRDLDIPLASGETKRQAF